MKKILLFVLLPFALFAQIQVTFQVNLAVQIKRGIFIPGSDSVVVRGDFQTDAGDAKNWDGNFFKMKSSGINDSIYKVTVSIPATKTGTGYLYKFVKNDVTWESNDNRSFTLGPNNITLYPYYFNNDSIYIYQKSVTVKVIFNADTRLGCDMRNSWIDDSGDSLQVEGFEWDNKATVLIGSQRKMHLADSSVKGIYTTTMFLTGFAGDSSQWKYRAYPTTAFTNTGWETGPNHFLNFPYSDSTVILPLKVLEPPVSDVPFTFSIVFSLNLNNTPLNAYTKAPIPVDKIEYITVYGSPAYLGGFQDNWSTSDSGKIAHTRFLNDSGLNGDKVPGDHIWSATIEMDKISLCDSILYRYGCFYPGADTVNHGTKPLDNEFDGTAYHQILVKNIQVGSTINCNDIWGSAATDIKCPPPASTATKAFTLQQNYPNPFNPSTVISFSLPKQSLVSLRIFNVLGEQVALLLNKEMPAGEYHIPFTAGALPSGIYFYRLDAGQLNVTKKMMLIK